MSRKLDRLKAEWAAVQNGKLSKMHNDFEPQSVVRREIKSITGSFKASGVEEEVARLGYPAAEVDAVFCKLLMAGRFVEVVA
jgi:hypothetical protein